MAGTHRGTPAEVVPAPDHRGTVSDMSADRQAETTAAAALTARGRCRIALGMMVREAVEYALQLIPTEGDGQLRPGEMIRAVRQLRALDLTPLQLAVAWEIAGGATWAEVAAALGLTEDDARGRYQESSGRWLANEPVPPGPVLPDGTQPSGLPPTPANVTIGDALVLERWYLRVVDPADRVARDGSAHPVTGELDWTSEA